MNKHITINVLPQDPESWLVIMVGLTACVFFYSLFWSAASATNSENDSKARIEQKAKP